MTKASYMITEKELDAAIAKINGGIAGAILRFSCISTILKILLARRERYKKELERQKFNNSLCLEFASGAEFFHHVRYLLKYYKILYKYIVGYIGNRRNCRKQKNVGGAITTIGRPICTK